MNKPNIAIASIILNDPAAPGANYTHAVEVAGGRPFFVGNIADEEEAQYILEHFDGLLHYVVSGMASRSVADTV